MSIRQRLASFGVIRENNKTDLSRVSKRWHGKNDGVGWRQRTEKGKEERHINRKLKNKRADFGNNMMSRLQNMSSKQVSFKNTTTTGRSNLVNDGNKKWCRKPLVPKNETLTNSPKKVTVFPLETTQEAKIQKNENKFQIKK